jgi:diguanylate cyclase (GGDEF)-like protein/PAS domain S-box-containing protein
MLHLDPKTLQSTSGSAHDPAAAIRIVGARATEALLTNAVPADPAEEIAALEAELAAAQDALRESRRQFGHLLGNLSGAVYQCRLAPPWNVTFASKGVEPLTGYRAETFEQGMAWAEVVHPEDLPAVEAEVAAGIAEERSFNCVYRIVRRSGEHRWVREQGRAVYDEDGTPLFLEGVIIDASAEKGHELALRAAEAEAKGRADRMRTILDAVPQMMWSHGTDGSLFYSRQFRDFTGIALGDPGSAERIDLVHPDDRERAQAIWRASRAAGVPYEAEYRLRHRDGDYRWVLSRANPERGEGGEIRAWYGTCTDIHQRVLAQEALDASQRLNRGIIEASPDCIALLAEDGTTLFLNEAANRVYAEDDNAELVGSRWGALMPEPLRSRAEAALAQAQAGEVVRLLVQYGRPLRWWDLVLAPIKSEGGDPMRIVVIARDVTDQKDAEEKAQWAANHDPLTGLPNRILFQHRVDEAIVEATRSGGAFGVLLLDVDDFKQVNDTLGHDTGDALLCTFADRMRAALRPEDTIARLGGDEFAVLLAGAGRDEQIVAAVDALLVKLGDPWFFGSRMLECQASIGASIFPRQGEDRAELLKNADVALYAAKASGRANLKLFKPEMRHAMQRRLSMLSLARDALERDWVMPFYQPKVDLRRGAPAGFEALLRWQHPTHGVQMPATIASAFEDVTLAAAISECMIDAVVRDLQLWRDQGLDVGHVAINASAAEFRRGDFAERLLEKLHRANLPPKLIQVEVTETVFLGRGAESVERALKLLSSAGVGIALDDFGTGYASLSHLKQFPVDFIKIDRTFVRDIEEDPGDAAIVDAVINLGRSLGIGIVAEGVENERQHAFLHALGCDYGQGFLYGKAAPAKEVPAMLRGADQSGRLRRLG